MTSTAFQDLSRVFHLIHSGEWERVPAATARLNSGPVPDAGPERDEYLRRLQDAANAARAARAHLRRRLAHAEAAQRFAGLPRIGTPGSDWRPGPDHDAGTE